MNASLLISHLSYLKLSFQEYGFENDISYGCGAYLGTRMFAFFVANYLPTHY